MNLRQTAELAGHFAAKADTIDNVSRLRIARAINRYRDCCRRRLQSWEDRIRHSEATDIEKARPCIVEVFVTEMLTTVWSAVFHAYGHRTDDAEIAAAAHDAFQIHQTARHEAMTWMLRNADQRPREIRAIDGIRRKCERWTDVMLGIITTPVDWHQYAHQPERARDFADENAGQASSVRSHMLFRSLRTAYATADYHHSQPVLFHEEVASALVLVLPSSSRFLASSAPIQFRSRAKNRTFRFSRLMANREASQSDQE